MRPAGLHVSSTVNQYCIAEPKLTLVVLVKNRKSVALASRSGMKKNMLMESTTAHAAVTPSSTYMSSVASCVTASSRQTNPMKPPMTNIDRCSFRSSVLSAFDFVHSSGNTPKKR